MRSYETPPRSPPAEHTLTEAQYIEHALWSANDGSLAHQFFDIHDHAIPSPDFPIQIAKALHSNARELLQRLKERFPSLKPITTPPVESPTALKDTADKGIGTDPLSPPPPSQPEPPTKLSYAKAAAPSSAHTQTPNPRPRSNPAPNPKFSLPKWLTKKPTRLIVHLKGESRYSVDDLAALHSSYQLTANALKCEAPGLVLLGIHRNCSGNLLLSFHTNTSCSFLMEQVPLIWSCLC
jgi:hypothetical protein